MLTVLNSFLCLSERYLSASACRQQRGFLTEQLCGFRQPRFVNIGNRQCRTPRREVLRQRPPDAGPRPGHYRHPTAQKRHAHTSSPNFTRWRNSAPRRIRPRPLIP